MEHFHNGQTGQSHQWCLFVRSICPGHGKCVCFVEAAHAHKGMVFNESRAAPLKSISNGQNPGARAWDKNRDNGNTSPQLEADSSMHVFSVQAVGSLSRSPKPGAYGKRRLPISVERGDVYVCMFYVCMKEVESALCLETADFYATIGSSISSCETIYRTMGLYEG